MLNGDVHFLDEGVLKAIIEQDFEIEKKHIHYWNELSDEGHFVVDKFENFYETTFFR